MAYSAEPGKTVAYSDDLRWRVVWQRLGKEKPCRDIAEIVNIGLGAVHNIWRLFEHSGQVTAKKSQPMERVLDEHSELLILGILAAEPDIYLSELRLHLQEVTGLEVSNSSMCRTIKRLGYTRKKVCQIALQRSAELRARFLAEVLMFPAEMFVWVDESGCQKKDGIRRFGYALRVLLLYVKGSSFVGSAFPLLLPWK